MVENAKVEENGVGSGMHVSGLGTHEMKLRGKNGTVGHSTTMNGNGSLGKNHGGREEGLDKSDGVKHYDAEGALVDFCVAMGMRTY